MPADSMTADAVAIATEERVDECLAGGVLGRNPGELAVGTAVASASPVSILPSRLPLTRRSSTSVSNGPKIERGDSSSA